MNEKCGSGFEALTARHLMSMLNNSILENENVFAADDMQLANGAFHALVVKYVVFEDTHFGAVQHHLFALKTMGKFRARSIGFLPEIVVIKNSNITENVFSNRLILVTQAYTFICSSKNL